MIVGNKDINLKELKKVYNNESLLNQFCMRQVPRYLWHNTAIVNNQKYLIALYLRKLESIPFKDREYWSNYLIDGITITGVPTRMVDFKDLLMYVDMDKLLQYIKQEKLKG